MTARTPLQRIRRNQRRRSQRGYFSIARNRVPFTNCHWCGDPIVWLRLLPKERRLWTDNHRYAKVEVDGKPVRFKLATLDHVTELKFGGTEDLSNIVPACAPCNNARNWEAKIVVQNDQPCVDCGGPRTGGGRRRCRKCIDARREEILARCATTVGETL